MVVVEQLKALLAEGLPARILVGTTLSIGGRFALMEWEGRFLINDLTKKSGPLLFSSKDFFSALRWLKDKFK